MNHQQRLRRLEHEVANSDPSALEEYLRLSAHQGLDFGAAAAKLLSKMPPLVDCKILARLRLLAIKHSGVLFKASALYETDDTGLRRAPLLTDVGDRTADATTTHQNVARFYVISADPRDETPLFSRCHWSETIARKWLLECVKHAGLQVTPNTQSRLSMGLSISFYLGPAKDTLEYDLIRASLPGRGRAFKDALNTIAALAGMRDIHPDVATRRVIRTAGERDRLVFTPTDTKTERAWQRASLAEIMVFGPHGAKKDTLFSNTPDKKKEPR